MKKCEVVKIGSRNVDGSIGEMWIKHIESWKSLWISNKPNWNRDLYVSHGIDCTFHLRKISKEKITNGIKSVA